MVHKGYNQSEVKGGEVGFLVSSLSSTTTDKASFGSLLFRQLALSPKEYVRVNADAEWDMFCTQRNSCSH